MSLYKTALANEFHYYAVETRQRREAEWEWASQDLERRGDRTYEEGSLAATLVEASAELREVLRVVAQAPSELLEILLAESDDEGWSRRLCRLCHVSISSSIVAELRSLLSGDEAA